MIDFVFYSLIELVKILITLLVAGFDLAFV
jgi:hypothetical protein